MLFLPRQYWNISFAGFSGLALHLRHLAQQSCYILLLMIFCFSSITHLLIARIYKQKFVFLVCKESGDSSLKLTGSSSVGLPIYLFIYAVVTSVKNLVYIKRCNCCRNSVLSGLTESNEYGNRLRMLKT